MIKTLATAAIAAGLIATAGVLSRPASASTASAPTAVRTAATTVPDCLAQSPPTCYTPQAFRAAYGIQPLLNRRTDGRGETVALLEEAEAAPANPPSVTDVRQDVAGFDTRFGLPPARLRVTATMAGSSADPWLANGEEVEDTELVHAVAPGATIVEMPLAAADLSAPANVAAAFTKVVPLAARQADVISVSDSFGEHFFTSAQAATIHTALRYAADRHVTFVASSGDHGAISDPDRFGPSAPVKEVGLPASDPFVLAAGGTSLTANPATGAYGSETTWNTLPETGAAGSAASGGGFSHLFARPAYADGVPGEGDMRGVPDVAADADGNTGMALATTEPGGGYALSGAGGTSASAPFWGALIALADQQAGHPLGFVNPAIYRIARSPLYRRAFHDITTGNNTVTVTSPPETVTGYRARPGWDPATGWGTPDAQVLVPLLAH